MSKNSKNTDPASWWFYFEQIGKDVAKCKHCPWEHDRGKAKGTHGLQYHLTKQHHAMPLASRI